jgi:hypothetical protein
MNGNQNNGQVFGGVFLLTLGGLFLYNNYFQIGLDWPRVFSFWPLILIVLGLLIIFGRVINFVVTITLAVILAVFVFGIFAGGSRAIGNWQLGSSSSKPVNNQLLSLDYTGQKKAELRLDIGAVDFQLNGTTSKLITNESSSNLGDYTIKSRIIEGVETIDLQIQDDRGAHMCIFCELKNTSRVRLNTNPTWNFDINMGAAKADINLADFTVDQFKLDTGAASVKIKMGEKQEKAKLDINAGAATLKLEVPKNSGLEIRTEGLIGKDFSGVNKVENNLYRTDNFDATKNKIYVNLSGLTNFEVTRY